MVVAIYHTLGKQNRMTSAISRGGGGSNLIEIFQQKGAKNFQHCGGGVKILEKCRCLLWMIQCVMLTAGQTLDFITDS